MAEQHETKAELALARRDGLDVVVRPPSAGTNEGVAGRQSQRLSQHGVGGEKSAARAVRPDHEGAVFGTHDHSLQAVRQRGDALAAGRQPHALRGPERHAAELQEPHRRRPDGRGNAVRLPPPQARRIDEGERIDGGFLRDQGIGDVAIEIAESARLGIEKPQCQFIHMGERPAREFAFHPHDSRRRSRPQCRGRDIQDETRRGAFESTIHRSWHKA